LIYNHGIGLDGDTSWRRSGKEAIIMNQQVSTLYTGIKYYDIKYGKKGNYL
jgi:hypothetical protein